MSEIGSIAARWHAGLTAGHRGAARRDQARLRRAATPLEALSIAATQDLHAAFADAERGMQHRPDTLALIAVALAHVDGAGGRSAAQVFGTGDPKALSSMRFEALIRATEPQDLWHPLRRALLQVKGAVNPARLAEDLYFWNDTTRARWCFDYHGVALAAPTQTEDTPSQEPAA